MNQLRFLRFLPNGRRARRCFMYVLAAVALTSVGSREIVAQHRFGSQCGPSFDAMSFGDERGSLLHVGMVPWLASSREWPIVAVGRGTGTDPAEASVTRFEWEPTEDGWMATFVMGEQRMEIHIVQSADEPGTEAFQSTRMLLMAPSDDGLTEYDRGATESRWEDGCLVRRSSRLGVHESGPDHGETVFAGTCEGGELVGGEWFDPVRAERTSHTRRHGPQGFSDAYGDTLCEFELDEDGRVSAVNCREGDALVEQWTVVWGLNRVEIDGRLRVPDGDGWIQQSLTAIYESRRVVSQTCTVTSGQHAVASTTWEFEYAE